MTQTCIEWLTADGWQPYTAWDTDARERQARWIEAEQARGSRQTFRIATRN